MHWVHDRRFVLRNLRDLGMGKTYLEQAIHVEAQALVDDIKSLGEKPMNPPTSLRTAVLNIIWQMVAGKRYDLRSREVDRIYSIIEDIQKHAVLMLLPYFFPVFNLITTIIRNINFRSNVLDDFSNEIHKIFSVMILKLLTNNYFKLKSRLNTSYCIELYLWLSRHWKISSFIHSTVTNSFDKMLLITQHSFSGTIWRTQKQTGWKWCSRFDRRVLHPNEKTSKRRRKLFQHWMWI